MQAPAALHVSVVHWLLSSAQSLTVPRQATQPLLPQNGVLPVHCVGLVPVPAPLQMLAVLAPAHETKRPGVHTWLLTQLPPWQPWPAGQAAFWN